MKVVECCIADVRASTGFVPSPNEVRQVRVVRGIVPHDGRTGRRKIEEIVGIPHRGQVPGIGFPSLGHAVHRVLPRVKQLIEHRVVVSIPDPEFPAGWRLPKEQAGTRLNGPAEMAVDAHDKEIYAPVQKDVGEWPRNAVNVVLAGRGDLDPHELLQFRLSLKQTLQPSPVGQGCSVPPQGRESKPSVPAKRDKALDLRGW